MKRDLQNIISGAISSLLGAILIAIVFLFISDYVFTNPNLTGKWFVINEVVKAKDDGSVRFTKRIGKKHIFQIFIIQKNEEITAYGHKIGEISNKGIYKPSSILDGKILIEGFIKKNYFKKDILNMAINEDNKDWNNFGSFQLKRFNDNYMFGEFKGTTLGLEAKSEWVHELSDLKEIILSKENSLILSD